MRLLLTPHEVYSLIKASLTALKTTIHSVYRQADKFTEKDAVSEGLLRIFDTILGNFGHSISSKLEIVSYFDFIFSVERTYIATAASLAGCVSALQRKGLVFGPSDSVCAFSWP